MGNLKVLITGATGFIGSHVAWIFCENGIEPTCLVRKTSDLSNIKELPISLRYGDITNPQSLIEAFRGVDFVIHTAALVSDWGRYDLFNKTNVTGTLNVLQACVANKIKHVIITGSNAVYGEEDSKIVKNEEAPYNSHYPYFADKIFPCKLNYYRDTKAQAKKTAITYAKANNLNLTILEPVWVYGERELNTGFLHYLQAAKNFPYLPGSNSNKFHVIYARDLARAYLLAFQKRLTGINSIIIGNQEIVLKDEINNLFCQYAGIKKPINAPKSISYPIGFILEAVYAILKIKKPPLLTRGRVNLFYDNIEYSTAKAKELLGFTSEYSLNEGIRKTVQWYKQRKII